VYQLAANHKSNAPKEPSTLGIADQQAMEAALEVRAAHMSADQRNQVTNQAINILRTNDAGPEALARRSVDRSECRGTPSVSGSSFLNGEAISALLVPVPQPLECLTTVRSPIHAGSHLRLPQPWQGVARIRCQAA